MARLNESTLLAGIDKLLNQDLGPSFINDLLRCMAPNTTGVATAPEERQPRSDRTAVSKKPQADRHPSWDFAWSTPPQGLDVQGAPLSIKLQVFTVVLVQHSEQRCTGECEWVGLVLQVPSSPTGGCIQHRQPSKLYSMFEVHAINCVQLALGYCSLDAAHAKGLSLAPADCDPLRIGVFLAIKYQALQTSLNLRSTYCNCWWCLTDASAA